MRLFYLMFCDIMYCETKPYLDPSVRVHSRVTERTVDWRSDNEMRNETWLRSKLSLCLALARCVRNAKRKQYSPRSRFIHQIKVVSGSSPKYWAYGRSDIVNNGSRGVCNGLPQNSDRDSES